MDYNKRQIKTDQSKANYSQLKSQLPLIILGMSIVLLVSILCYYLDQKIQLNNNQIVPKTYTQTSEIRDNTKDWRTFINSVYKYSLSAPQDFNLKMCQVCNPPEINFALENPTHTIAVGAAYGQQGSLIANYSSPPIPVRNLRLSIQWIDYEPEEYFDKTNNRYIFKININKDGQYSQIDLNGYYASLNDVKLVSDIISSFKFLDQNQTKQACGEWNPGGEIICECSGKLTKSACPKGAICDGEAYYCDGICGQCCYKGGSETSFYPKCK